jgi:hypothetical protein
MRPLRVPLQPGEAAEFERPGRDVVPLLLDRLGAYCSICERPLLQEVLAWDAETGSTISAYSPFAPSVRSLLLCRTCDAFQSVHLGHPPVLPFEGPTFTVGGPRLFEYPSSGAVRGPSETILYFALDRPPQVDPRARLRLWTRRTADAAAERVRNDPTGLEAHWLPHLIVATGFLSVWAEALLEHLEDLDRVGGFFNIAREQISVFFPGTDWARFLHPPLDPFPTPATTPLGRSR